MTPVTDPAILQQLNAGLKPVTDPAILAQLDGGSQQAPVPAASMFDAVQAAHPVPHKGYAAQVSAMAAQGPDKGTVKPISELKQNWTDVAGGAATGVLTGTPGIPGNIEAMGRAALSKMLPVSTQTVLPTSGELGNAVAGEPSSPYASFGRTLGEAASPLGYSKAAEGAFAVGRTSGRKLFSGGGPTPEAQAAHEAGFVIPPGEASAKPGPVTSFMGGVGGKIKMQQQASTMNAPKVNALAARAVGLPEDQPITEAALEGVRHQAGQAYEAVRRAPVEIIPDATFKADLAKLHDVGAAARAEVPEIVGNPELDTLHQVLNSKEKLSPDASVDLIRSLRFKSQTNLKNFGSPEKMQLGRAQSKAANALETLVERNLEAATTARGPIGAQGGDMTELVANLQNARRTIAKTYDIEGALNQATGHIDASKFAKLAAKGRPLTDELAQIGESAANFPKNFQDPTKFGRTEKVSKLDVAAGVLSHGLSLPLSFAGPVVRRTLLSSPYQKLLMGTAGPARAPFGMPSISAATLAQLLNSASNETR